MSDNAKISAAAHCLERMREDDKLVSAFGIELLECRPGYGKAVMPLDTRQLNGAGIAHGGALFALADIAMALAANSDGALALTLNASISFLKAGSVAPFTAEAREVSASSRVAHYEVLVTDGNGEAVARLHGIAYKKLQASL